MGNKAQCAVNGITGIGMVCQYYSEDLDECLFGGECSTKIQMPGPSKYAKAIEDLADAAALAKLAMEKVANALAVIQTFAQEDNNPK